MKRKILPLFTTLSIISTMSFSSFAEENKTEILFRNIPWGTNYADIKQELSDFDWYDMSFDMMRTYSVYEVLTDSPYADGVLDFENSGINMIAQPFSNKETEVAGYTTTDIQLFFAYTPIDGTLPKDDINTALYGATYSFSPQNLQQMSEDLISKLSYLYGEADQTTTDKDIFGNKTSITWWSGDNDTHVVLRTIDSSEDTSDLYDDELFISYACGKGDEFLKEADDTISTAKSDKESSNYGNGNTTGL